MNNLISLARDLAVMGHKDQKRRDGKPYFTHCEAVAKITEKELKRFKLGREFKTLHIASAYLHDCLEDQPDFWFKNVVPTIRLEVIKIVETLTRRKKETYFDFIMRIRNEDCLNCKVVKLADLQHNMSDLEEGSLKDKYRFAEYILKNPWG